MSNSMKEGKRETRRKWKGRGRGCRQEDAMTVKKALRKNILLGAENSLMSDCEESFASSSFSIDWVIISFALHFSYH